MFPLFGKVFPHSLCVLLLSAVAARGAEAAGPAFSCADPAYVQGFRKAQQVIAKDTTAKREFMAGESWNQVWTRDSSYATDLALGLLEPEICRTTLLAQKEDVPGFGECWLQDQCGHFGGWPNLTDAIVGAHASWSLYLITGDKDFLLQSHARTTRSLARAEKDAFDQKTGLFGGCSSFMESNSGYPRAYAGRGAMVAGTKALSTNLLYYRGYVVAAEGARVLGQDGAPFRAKAEQLARAINARFWNADKGNYAYFLDRDGSQSDRMEGLGEALSILFGVADERRAASVLQKTPTTPQGLPCLWPQFADWLDYRQPVSSYYHNGMIWPFVQGYWGRAAAERKDVPVFAREFAALLRLSQQNDTFMEFYRPEDAAPGGSRDQLWSAAGYFSMVYHGLAGMRFEESGIRFAPVVPPGLGTIRLTAIKYRGSVLDLTITGAGTRVRRFQVDGLASERAQFGVGRPGAHHIEIELGE